jgi:branched-chain amino acid transport system permease protein
VISVLVGLPTLRLDGVFVAVTTLVFALAASGYFLVRAQFGWIPSVQLSVVSLFGVPLGSQTAVFFVCLGAAVLGYIALHGLRHSRTGRVWRAVGVNERAAAGFGVGVARAKLSAFATAGLIAGMAGCLLVVVNEQYIEQPFGVPQSLLVLTATVVGGVGSAGGAIAGAALIEGSAVFLPPSWQLVPAAFGVLIVLMVFPGGVAGACARGRDRLLDVVARRHGMWTPRTISSGPTTDPGAGPDGRGRVAEGASRPDGNGTGTGTASETVAS